VLSCGTCGKARVLRRRSWALRAGLSPNAVGTLERGARKHPYPHTVRSLAEALGLSQDERATLLAAVPRRDAHTSGVRPPPRGQHCRAPRRHSWAGSESSKR
jgi:hypothetical protein